MIFASSDILILAKEGRLLKPFKKVCENSSQVTRLLQEQTFVYQPLKPQDTADSENLNDQEENSVTIEIADYQLPSFKDGGPGIAPVATVKGTGMAILTDKVTGAYQYIPRIEGEQRQTMVNTGYAAFMKKFKQGYPAIDIQESVMAFVPNWIEPKYFFILYKASTQYEEKDMNYKGLKYNFGDQGYVDDDHEIIFEPCNGAEKQCQEHLKVSTLPELFKIKSNHLSLRQEISPAVSENQVFFYLRQTAQRKSARPTITFDLEKGIWAVAVQDNGLVMQNRKIEFSNVFVDKDEKVFITGTMPSKKSPAHGHEVSETANYYQKCEDGKHPVPKYCRYESLDGPGLNVGKPYKVLKETESFHFPLAYYPQKTSASPPHCPDIQSNLKKRKVTGMSSASGFIVATESEPNSTAHVERDAAQETIVHQSNKVPAFEEQQEERLNEISSSIQEFIMFRFYQERKKMQSLSAKEQQEQRLNEISSSIQEFVMFRFHQEQKKIQSSSAQKQRLNEISSSIQEFVMFRFHQNQKKIRSLSSQQEQEQRLNKISSSIQEFVMFQFHQEQKKIQSLSVLATASNKDKAVV